MTRLITMFAAALVAVFLLGTYWFGSGAKDGDVFAACRSGAVAGDIGGPFELVDSQGRTVTDKDVITEPSLLYFGYTYCPDVCPLDVDRNATAVDILEERGQMVTPVFISIDPARDTPDVVGEFATNMHPRMVGLTGSPAQVKAASEAYRTYYKAHEATDGDYLVDHSTMSYLVMPDAGFVQFFRRDISAEDMADQISCFVNEL